MCIFMGAATTTHRMANADGDVSCVHPSALGNDERYHVLFIVRHLPRAGGSSRKFLSWYDFHKVGWIIEIGGILFPHAEMTRRINEKTKNKEYI
jgi:hypothetical protein